MHVAVFSPLRWHFVRDLNGTVTLPGSFPWYPETDPLENLEAFGG